MDVAVLFSGGKDSTFAIQKCIDEGWNIKYLISVKPTRTDCYLYHFATVEHTKLFASLMNIPQVYLTCDVADPVEEAKLVYNVVKNHLVDAVVLGGTGLQETQIRSIREVLFPLGVEVFASHAGQDHGELLLEMINQGFKIMITQIASDGLDKTWLGRVIDENSFVEFKKLSEKYGFHLGGEGGYYDSLVVDCPLYTKRFEVLESEKVMESKNAGHLLIKKAGLLPKEVIIKYPFSSYY